MSTFILTYNPAKWTWEAKERRREITGTAAGREVRSHWSTGGRRTGIAPGDRAILLVQGSGLRGIVGLGRFTSEIYQDGHWDDKRGSANYARMNWTRIVSDDDRIATEELLERVPGVPWNNLQSSGVRVRDEAEADLELALAEWVGESRGPQPPGPTRRSKPKSSQGRQQDAVRRVLVEDHAQRILEDHYRALKWTVVDVRLTKPFDAEATKGRKKLYLEAKGTESSGRSVKVTRGEVNWAKQNPGQCVLGVVSGITFIGDAIDSASGTLALYDWDPGTGKLVPDTYTWTPPPTR